MRQILSRVARESSPLPYCLLQRFDELLKSQPERQTEHPQLHHVDPPFPALTFRDERLGFPEPLGQLYLREAGPLSRSFEGLEENGVTGGVDGLFHCVLRTQRSKTITPTSNSPTWTIVNVGLEEGAHSGDYRRR
jgi:hypothetical protein